MSETQNPNEPHGSPQGVDRKDADPEQQGGVTQHGSESENPAIDSPQPKQGRPHTNQDWWPNQLDLKVLHAHSPQATRSVPTSTTPRSSPSSTWRS